MGDTKAVDLHVWTIGPGKHGAIDELEASAPRGVQECRRTSALILDDDEARFLYYCASTDLITSR
ncbi:MAG: hypothetical protein ACYC6C_10030 [Coriobacteriia bacterium]